MVEQQKLVWCIVMDCRDQDVELAVSSVDLGVQQSSTHYNGYTRDFRAGLKQRPEHIR